jgi:hypothetical protein
MSRWRFREHVSEKLLVPLSRRRSRVARNLVKAEMKLAIKRGRLASQAKKEQIFSGGSTAKRKVPLWSARTGDFLYPANQLPV